MTERRRTTKLDDFRGPPGLFRVIAWYEAGAVRETWIEGDFEQRADARLKVDDVKAAGAMSVAIYDSLARVSYVRSDLTRTHAVPISVTRMSGQSDPLKRPKNHRRR